VFAPGAIDHVLRPVVRTWMTHQQREQCRFAAAAAYVTKSALQQRYPCGGFAVGVSDVQLGEGTFREPFSTHYSSVQLDDAAFASSPQKAPAAALQRIVTVGSLEHPYKGTDLLIEALATVLKRRSNVELVVIGDGRHRPALERQAEELGVSQSVQFRGHISSVLDVRRELNAASLFVLPSRTEGLPRAMVEAMARGLACIGSAVGGGDLSAPWPSRVFIGASTLALAFPVSVSPKLEPLRFSKLDRVSVPAPPFRVSFPARPDSRLAPPLPRSELAAALPVPVRAAVPVRVRDSTSAGRVKLTAAETRSVPSPGASTIASAALSTL